MSTVIFDVRFTNLRLTTPSGNRRDGCGTRKPDGETDARLRPGPAKITESLMPDSRTAPTQAEPGAV